MMETSAMAGTLSSTLRAVGQDGRGHQLQHGVLGSAHGDGAGEGRAGPDDDAVHWANSMLAGDGEGAPPLAGGATRPPRLLATPRTDLLDERREPDGSFAQAHGPFSRYRRTLAPEPGGAVVETTDYHLAIPWFGWLFALPVRFSPAQAAAPYAGAMVGTAWR